MEGWWPLEEVHLGLLARWMFHYIRYIGVFPVDPTDDTLDRRVAVAEAVF